MYNTALYFGCRPHRKYLSDVGREESGMFCGLLVESQRPVFVFGNQDRSEFD